MPQGTMRRIPNVTSDELIRTPLIGMISAHWKYSTSPKNDLQNDLDGKVEIGSGIAVLIPAKNILDFIMKKQSGHPRPNRPTKRKVSEVP
jgi:hypothetical protein